MSLIGPAYPPARRESWEWIAKRRQSESHASGGQKVASAFPNRRRILVLCLGGIGDTVLAFAALRDLRRTCPKDHLTALAMWKQSAELLADLGIFDEILQHNFQKERFWRSMMVALRLRASRHEVSLLTFPANRYEYNVLARILGTPRRFGHTYVRGSDWANCRFLLTHRVNQAMGRHTIDENRMLVGAFTGAPPVGMADIRLGPLDPRYHEYSEHMLGHLERPLLGFHPGCSTYKGHEVRRWPAERFGELCHRVHSELGMQPVVFGLPDEWQLKLQIQAACPQVYLAHGPTIRHTAALIARCSAFVSNDSALAHIASALDVPVTMICGPTVPSSIRPFTDSGRAVTARLPCSPCFLVGRKPLSCKNPEHQACLKRITVEMVLNGIRDGIEKATMPCAQGRQIDFSRSFVSRLASGFPLPVMASAGCR